MLSRLRTRARALKTETLALYYAMRDPRTPWYARAVALLTLAYALSPIDLIPDFIPVLGYLDDLLIVPLGIVIALKLIPAQVMQECRIKAAAVLDQDQPASKAAAAVIITIWVLLIALVIWQVYRRFAH